MTRSPHAKRFRRIQPSLHRGGTVQTPALSAQGLPTGVKSASTTSRNGPSNTAADRRHEEMTFSGHIYRQRHTISNSFLLAARESRFSDASPLRARLHVSRKMLHSNSSPVNRARPPTDAECPNRRRMEIIQIVRCACLLRGTGENPTILRRRGCCSECPRDVHRALEHLDDVRGTTRGYQATALGDCADLSTPAPLYFIPP